MNYLKTHPLFLFLLPLFFCLHGSVENFGYVSPFQVIKLGLIILAVLIFIFFIIRFFTKNSRFAALITFYIGLWNLFFGALHNGIKGSDVLSWLSSYSILLPLLVISTVIWVIVLKRKKKFREKLVYYFNILLVIYCLYDISILLIKSFGNRKVTKKHFAFDYSKVTIKPNVYYLLFDGYPGYKTLKERFGYSNDSLYSYFKNNGFEILPTRANYNFTYFSLSSVFNMDYLANVPAPDSITEKDYLQQMIEIKNAAVFRIFSSMGYTIKNLSIFNIRDQHSFANNETVPSDIQLFTHKILYRKFFKDVGWKFVTGENQIPFLKKIFFGKDDFNKSIEENLYKNLGKKSSPRFLYAHFFLPHQPIYFDSAGNYLPEKIILSGNTVLNKNYYLGYLKYTNTKIVSITNEIIKNDPGAIIIIMSDHGYGYFTDKSLIPYHFDNICAVRSGASSCLNARSEISGVNIFRYLFNCSFNQKLPYLEDSSIFLTDFSPE